MALFIRTSALILWVLAALSLSACSVRQQLLRHVADEWTQASVEEEDVGLAREASAFYLKLSESLLRAAPGHVALAETVTSGLTQYAYAFLVNEADRMESTQLQQAQGLRERASRMYARARQQGWATLVLNHPDWPEQLNTLGDRAVLTVRPVEVGLM